MFEYPFSELSGVLTDIVRKNTSENTFRWLTEQSKGSLNQFTTAFVLTPRKTGKDLVVIDDAQIILISHLRPGLYITNWSIDRLARVWLLMHLDAADKEKYFSSIESLFRAAEVNELIALYSSLPLLAYPPIWAARCTEGIRNNIADVLTAIMCNNPYPSEQLNEAAWNQLVLKAFFTEKPVHEIIGLDKRANEKLASTLSDYAHERWAAGRSVDPQLWRNIAPFINENNIPDIQRIAGSASEMDRAAAALCAHNTTYLPAQKLTAPYLETAIQSGELTWKILAEKTKDYVLQ